MKLFLEICIQTNITEHMVVGNKLMNIIGYISTVGKDNESVISFHMKTDECSKLLLRSFDFIEIRLTDLDGNTIQIVEDGNIPTVVNMMFVNFT